MPLLPAIEQSITAYWLLLISRPIVGRRLSWPKHIVGYQLAPGCLQLDQDTRIGIEPATSVVRMRYSATGLLHVKGPFTYRTTCEWPLSHQDAFCTRLFFTDWGHGPMISPGRNAVVWGPEWRPRTSYTVSATPRGQHCSWPARRLDAVWWL